MSFSRLDEHMDQQNWTPAHDGSRGYHVNAEPAHVMAVLPAGRIRVMFPGQTDTGESE